MRRLLPRIYHVHPPLVGDLANWPQVLDRAAALGFDHVAIAPPFAPGRRAGIFAPSDPDRAHPAFGGEADVLAVIGRLAALCRERGLTLLVDVVIHQVAAEAVGAAESRLDDLPDPRREPSKVGAVPVDFGSEAGHRHAEAWRERLARLVEAGAGAIGIYQAARIPAEILAHVAGGASGAWRLGYAPDAGPSELQALERTGLDAVLGFLGGRGAVLFREREAGAGTALIAAPELPFGRRLAAEHLDGTLRERAAMQALRLSAGLGDGILVPMGFEHAARRSLDPRGGSPAEIGRLAAAGEGPLVATLREVNAFLASDAAPRMARKVVELTDPGDRVVAMLRSDAADLDSAGSALLVIANRDLSYRTRVEASSLLRMAGGRFGPFEPVIGSGAIAIGTERDLGPGEVWIGRAEPLPMICTAIAPGPDQALAAARAPRLGIEKVTPSVEGGFPVKRTVGDVVTVEADIVTDGHEVLRAMLLWREDDAADWQETPMRPLGNDRWTADFPLRRVGRHRYAIETWIGPFATYRAGLVKKVDAGVNVGLEIEEGRRLIARWAEGASGTSAVAALRERMEAADEAGRLSILLDAATDRIMAAADPRPQAVRSEPVIVDSERVRAEFASWYEIFPRSQAAEPGRHGTFLDVIARLPRIRDMGFDVLYFPPIHPIGRTNRKGRNNSLQAGPDEPGSPYAIGSEEGGHDALHPELGSFEDFEKLCLAAADYGLELAIDFAIQCSPDHPWIREHPEWFDWRPDGTIKFAENPPKKYEDIVNVDFYAEGAIPSLWLELRDIVRFWCEKGIRLFRVDNPHTKPFPFWEWMIREVRGEYPDAVFLSEAFTRPKVMYRLAKIGFSQSYTYFTWRTRKWEFEQYLTEITQTEVKEFFRPHFFVNTPDINPPYLHSGERPWFLCRAALAATLSGLWGVYNGFELCEGRPVPGKEEYLNSEKYEIRHWDYDRPGNIAAEITQLNRIRRENPALRSHHGISFLPALNDNVLFYVKQAPGGRNTVLCAVNLDPVTVQEADVEVPHHLLGLPDHGTVGVEDLMTGSRWGWTGRWHRLRLEPERPFGIWRLSAG
jgi:starch synthase (maltosyl-transferring)